MRVVDAAVMRKLDAFVIEELTMPGLLLMENAARAVADNACDILNGCRGKNIIVLAGKGNNGGDGFGAARWLANRGASVRVLLLGCKEELRGDAKAELDYYVAGGGFIEEIIDEKYDFTQNFKEADLLIDALLGTGFQGELRPLYKKACAAVNAAKALVLAVDIPTGVNADSGAVAESAVMADFTVTMALPKTGLLLYPGKDFAGNLVVADIGMPAALLQEEWIAPKRRILPDQEFINALIPVRFGNCHKGKAGRVAVIAGSPGFTGAAALCSEAAVRSGAGLVSLYTMAPPELLPAEKLTEVMVSKISATDENESFRQADQSLLEKTASVDAVAIGPGLGTDAVTAEKIRNFLMGVQGVCVVDADALTAICGHTEMLSACKGRMILTPHPGEMARLTGLSVAEVEKNRISLAERCAVKWGCVLVLKGAPTVTALPDGKVFINSSGNAAMATGGCGDVLTGVIAGLAAQGAEAEAAAIAGVYLHGLAGDMAAEGIEAGMKAGDINNFLPYARAAIRKAAEL